MEDVQKEQPWSVSIHGKEFFQTNSTTEKNLKKKSLKPLKDYQGSNNLRDQECWREREPPKESFLTFLPYPIFLSV